MATSQSPFSLDQLKDEGYTGPVSILSADQAAAGRRAFFDAVGQLQEQGIDYLARTALVCGEDRYHYNDSLTYQPPA